MYSEQQKKHAPEKKTRQIATQKKTTRAIEVQGHKRRLGKG
jgi:hypothetical protein